MSEQQRGSARRGRRSRAVLAVAALFALVLAGCGSALPNTVVVGSDVTLGWAHSMTSTNAASAAAATTGNLDVAALTRGQFAEVVDGAVVIDEGFGTVRITDPESFTVRYDLAEPQWSDGIAVDAADLLLAWAAGSNVPSTIGAHSDVDPGAAEKPELSVLFDSLSNGLQHSAQVVAYDEFARWIDVRYNHPVEDWRTALDVAVPAHVVGALAFDLNDPMEAKQAVITAIEQRDTDGLAAIAEVWNTGFDLPSGDGSNIPPELLLSSGPYRIEQVDQSRSDAQNVRFVVNTEYTGSPTAEYERIELAQTVAANPLAEFGRTFDVVQVEPTSDNWERIRDLERVDHGVSTTHTGSMWTLILNVDRGEFSWYSAREAFLRAAPHEDMAEAGAGRWADAYSRTSAMVFTPGMPGYQIALEDSGFRESVGARVRDDDAAEERAGAGVEDGAQVCVLYDTGEPFAAAAFEALQQGVAEAGWDVRDCGAEDVVADAEDSADWDAILTTVPVPISAAQVAAQWGSDGESSWSGSSNTERDALIEELARTFDEYEARDLRVQIEATIVDDALAVPIAMQPMVTVSHRNVHGVNPRPGPAATVTSGVVEWSIADD